MVRTRRKRQSKTSVSGISTIDKGDKARKLHLNVHHAKDNAEAWPEFRVPPSMAQPKHVFTTCHYCGYEPVVIPPDATCPKCGGHSWERNAISVRLLPKTK